MKAIMKNNVENGMKMDEIDKRILKALQEDARRSFSALGRLINLSQPAVAERVRRMERRGIITGYHAQVNPAAVGLPIRVIIQFVSKSSKKTAINFIQATPAISECLSVTGKDCFVLRADVASIAALDQLLTALGKLGETDTSIILSDLMERRAIELI